MMKEVKVMAEVCKDDEEAEENEPKEWEIEGWANTLVCAEEIKNDPKKMRLVAPLLEKKTKAIKSIDGLRRRIAKRYETD